MGKRHTIATCVMTLDIAIGEPLLSAFKKKLDRERGFIPSGEQFNPDDVEKLYQALLKNIATLKESLPLDFLVGADKTQKLFEHAKLYGLAQNTAFVEQTQITVSRIPSWEEADRFTWNIKHALDEIRDFLSVAPNGNHEETFRGSELTSDLDRLIDGFESMTSAEASDQEFGNYLTIQMAKSDLRIVIQSLSILREYQKKPDWSVNSIRHIKAIRDVLTELSSLIPKPLKASWNSLISALEEFLRGFRFEGDE